MAEKRPYLRSDNRKRQLLDATSDLIASDGLPGVTMVAVAERAGVSRRLVYDHFSDLPSLFEAFFADRVARYLAMFDEAFASADGKRDAAISAAFQVMLTIPASDVRIIRLLTLDGGVTQVAETSEFVRERLLDRWQRFMPDDLDDDVSHALIWTIFSGLMGLAEVAAREEISPELALDLGVRFAVAASESASAVRPGSVN